MPFAAQKSMTVRSSASAPSFDAVSRAVPGPVPFAINPSDHPFASDRKGKSFGGEDRIRIDPQTENAGESDSSTGADVPSSGVSEAPKSADAGSRSNADERNDRPGDVVEAALADALARAAAAGQWEAVGALTRELEARRRARIGVVDLDAARAKGGRNAV